MTNQSLLLVSVRTVKEAEIAFRAGVEWIDLKEPSSGPMGRANWDVVETFLGLQYPANISRSIAGGELNAWTDDDLVRLPTIPSDCYIKIGLSGCRGVEWFSRIGALIQHLRFASQCIVVHYADFETADAPSWEEVVQSGHRHGCKYVLIDTFDKSCGCLTDIYGATELRTMIKHAKRLGIEVAIAGSIRCEHVSTLKGIGAYCIGVRGAVCDENNRTGQIVASRIELLRSMLFTRNKYNEHVVR